MDPIQLLIYVVVIIILIIVIFWLLNHLSAHMFIAQEVGLIHYNYANSGGGELLQMINPF